MTFGLIGAGLATADDDGMMAAADFSALSGVAPTDPTDDILTSTASLTYQSGTGSCVSTLDGITLSFDWVYDEGCAAAAVAAGVLVAVLGVAATDAGRMADPPQPGRSPVGPSDVIFQRVARGELSPEEGARSLEIGRERRPVDVVSFEDAWRAAQQPNARKGEP